jgi:hypothetical protein
MIEPTGKKIITTLIILLLVDMAFFPIASADSTGTGNIGGYDGITKDGSTAYSKNSVGAAPLIAPVVIGIFGIEIGADIAAILGVASGGIMIVRYNDGSLAFVNTAGDYIKITNAVAHAAINGILDTLGLRSAPSSYTEAYRKGLPTDNHKVDTRKPDPCDKGTPFSSYDYTTRDGKLLTRYYYKGNGNLEITWDYDHPHKKIPPPHSHRWIFENEICVHETMERPQVTFNSDGTEVLNYS